MNKKTIQFLITILLLIVLAVYFYYHSVDFKKLEIVNGFYILPVIFFTFIVFIVNGLVLKFLLRPFNIMLKSSEWFGLSVITALGNYISFMQGGAVARAVYLKKKYDFSYTNFLSTLAGIYILVFFITSLVGLADLIFIKIYSGAFNYLVFLIFLILFSTLFSIIMFSPRLPKTRYTFLNKFIDVANGWHLIRKNKIIIGYISALTFINIFILSLIMLLEFKVFGLDVSLPGIIFLVIISSLTVFINITPGALGIREGLMVLGAGLINISVTQVLAVSILDRLITMVLIFILGPIFSYWLLGRVLRINKIEN